MHLVTGRNRRRATIGAVVALALTILFFALIEGDFVEELGDFRGFVGGLLGRLGVAAALILLYLEESGVPLPVPGDVYVVYLGSVTHGEITRWVMAWLGVIAVVVAGASNLYLISRRWGPRLITHRLAPAFHIDAERVRQVQVWFDRWGPIVIIFGRHVPGFRIPITVVSGTLQVKYRYFAPSVAISTAIWSGFWLTLGALYGSHASDFLRANRWIYVLIVVVVAVVVAYFLVRLWQAARQRS